METSSSSSQIHFFGHQIKKKMIFVCVKANGMKICIFSSSSGASLTLAFAIIMILSVCRVPQCQVYRNEPTSFVKCVHYIVGCIIQNTQSATKISFLFYLHLHPSQHQLSIRSKWNKKKLCSSSCSDRDAEISNSNRSGSFLLLLSLVWGGQP